MRSGVDGHRSKIRWGVKVESVQLDVVSGCAGGCPAGDRKFGSLGSVAGGEWEGRNLPFFQSSPDIDRRVSKRRCAFPNEVRPVGSEIVPSLGHKRTKKSILR